MTDVQVTLERCDHVIDPHEALAQARQLTKLAEAALQADLNPATVDLVIERGMITQKQIGDILAGYYTRGGRAWPINVANLWRKFVWPTHNMSNPPHAFSMLSFDIMCFDCEIPRHQCTKRHRNEAIKVDQLLANASCFSKYLPSRNIGQNYARVVQHVTKALATA